MDKEEKWIDINIDGEDNVAIQYNYNSLEDLIIWQMHERELDFRKDKEKKKTKLEAIENDIQLIWLLYIAWLSYYLIFMWFY